MGSPDDRTVNGGPTDASYSSKPYSCVICHKRKVKCDRNEPCSNCAKSNAECIYRPPPPPRRRKRERDAGGSASHERDKSRRMTDGESLLDDVENSPLPSRPTPDGLGVQKGGSGRMIMKDGNSVYLDKSVILLEDICDRANSRIAHFGPPLVTRCVISVSRKVCDYFSHHVLASKCSRCIGKRVRR